MNKRSLIIQTICLLTIIPIAIITQKLDIFQTILAVSIYFILKSTFKHININKSLDNQIIPILSQTIKSILLLSTIYLILLYPISLITSQLLQIKNLTIPFLIIGLLIPLYQIIKLANEYTKIKNITKINILDCYYIITTVILIITSIVISYALKLDTNLNNIILIASLVLSAIITIILIYLYLHKNLNIKRLFKSKPSLKITQIIKTNIHISILSVIQSSYLYISIIYVYYLLKNIYNYSLITITQIITNTYCYGLLFILAIALIIIFIIDSKYNLSDKQKLPNNLSIIYHRLSVILLPIIIIMIILSNAIWTLLFGTNTSSYILIGLSILLFFLIFYIITIRALTNIKDKKIPIIITLIGLTFKLIFTPAIIDSFYRMGYPLVMGDIVSTTISYILVIIIGNYFIKKNYKVAIFSNLEKILNIIYNNIILMVELILLQLIITINPTTRSKALLLILIYSVIGLIFYVIRLYITKRNKKQKEEE